MKSTSTLFLFCIFFFAQNAVYCQQPIDTNTALDYLESAKKYRFINTDSVVRYCDLALALSEKLNYENGKGKSYTNLGLYYTSKGDYQKAIDLHLRAKTIFEKLKNEDQVAKCIHNIGYAYEAA